MIGPQGVLLRHHGGGGTGAYLLGSGSPVIVDGAWSLRQLNAAMTKCVAVRRDWDNSIADIGFDGAKGIDQTALLAHVTGSGAHPTANGYISTWYDQSVASDGITLNARDQLEPNTAWQYRIVNNGSIEMKNGLPAARAPDQRRGYLTNSFTAYTGVAVTGFCVGVLPSAASDSSPQFLGLLPTAAGVTDANVGGAVLIARQDGELIGKTGNLVDPLTIENDNLWTGWATGVGIVSSQLNIACASNYPGITSAVKYDFTESFALVRLVQRTNRGNNTTETILEVRVDSGNYVSFLVSGTNLNMRERAGGVNSDTGVAYSTTNHKWLRIRMASGTIYWETAPDVSGAPGTWTVQRSKAIAMSSPTNASIIIQAGYYGTETSPGTAIFDNFNTNAAIAAGTSWAVERAVAAPCSAPATASTLQQITSTGNGGTYSISVDGNTPVTGSGSSSAYNFNRYSIGHNGIIAQSATDQYVSEVLVANKLMTSTDQATVQTSQRVYWGTPAPAGTTDPSSGYTFVDEDTFDVNDLSGNWVVYNNGVMTSNAGAWMSSQVTISGGTLNLAAKRVTTPVNGYNVVGGAAYWEGHLNDAFARGGMWEGRVRCDAMAGIGLAILLWPQDPANWPTKGEIDLLELYSTNTSKFGGETNCHLDTTLNSGRHLKMPGSSTHSSGSDVSAGNWQIDWTTYHKIQLAWVPGQFIQMYIDGIEKGYTTDLSYVPSGTAAVPMRLTFQQEHYGSSDSVVSTTAGLSQVDSVRYYAAP